MHPWSECISSTGDRMEEKGETPSLRNANSKEIYISNKGAEFKIDPRQL